MSRAVTEQDFRRPEFRDARPEDYEFRSDGVLVRKDRWEVAVRHLASALGCDPRSGFEIDDLMRRLDGFVARAMQAGIEPCDEDEELGQ